MEKHDENLVAPKESLNVKTQVESGMDSFSEELYRRVAIPDSTPEKILEVPESTSDVFINEKEVTKDTSTKSKKKMVKWCNRVKLFMLFLCWLICSCILMSTSEKVEKKHQVSIAKNTTTNYMIHEYPSNGNLRLILEGALLPPYYGNLSKHWIDVWIVVVETVSSTYNGVILDPSEVRIIQNVSEVWRIPTVTEKLIGVVPEVTLTKMFTLNYTQNSDHHCFIEIQMKTNLMSNFPISMEYNLEPINTDAGIIWAAIVLMTLYLMIIFEIVHRTLAAMLASTMSVAILAYFNARPTMSEIISWIDIETLLLLFSMMTLVTITSETGIFDYLSVQAYKITCGKIWPLIYTLCLITAILSCFLDNVTIALLITPISIKLSEVMKLNPVPVLICLIICSNVGGAITPIGDPPNVIIASNPDVIKSGVNFLTFTLHMGIGVFIAFIVVFIQLKYFYRDINKFRYPEPIKVQENSLILMPFEYFLQKNIFEYYFCFSVLPQWVKLNNWLELKREIATWRRTAASLSSYSKDEDIVRNTLMKRTSKLLGKLQSSANKLGAQEEEYNTNLEDLQKQYPIKEKVLLIKSGCTLLLVICVFFLHSIPSLSRLGLGWTALLGALLLLLLYDKENVEAVFVRIEWSTLLFFASLFILMEALSRLGLIDWVGIQTQTIITSVDQDARLSVAIILILWVSGVASAFVDNLPLTTMMIRIATDLASNRELNLPLQPLVWALSFGACLGGNGSLLGSSANIVCAGVAEQHGYRFTFMEFLKIGLPIMLSTMSVITVYLIISHVVIGWNY